MKTPTPLGLPYDPRHRPTVGFWGDLLVFVHSAETEELLERFSEELSGRRLHKLELHQILDPHDLELQYRACFIGKKFQFDISGNEVYCTNALLLAIKIMLCSTLHCQIFQD